MNSRPQSSVNITFEILSQLFSDWFVSWKTQLLGWFALRSIGSQSIPELEETQWAKKSETVKEQIIKRVWIGYKSLPGRVYVWEVDTVRCVL